MHDKFGVNPIVREFNAEKLRKFIEFRFNFLQEELNEAQAANNCPIKIDGNEAIVDAMIDLCVVAIGTLNALDIDLFEAWDRVHVCNMTKQVGIKATRPNPLGLPDLIKPPGWIGPSHQGNHGLLIKL